MKVLQICFRMPWPLKDGGAIAMYNLFKGLYEQGCDMTLLVPVTQKHDLGVEELPAEVRKMADFHSIRINSSVTVIGALLNLFTRKPYYISRYENKAFEDKLINLLKSDNFDIVLFESLKTAPYLKIVRKYSSSRCLLRSHNVEYMIWERMRIQSRNIFKKIYLGILVSRLKKYEMEISNLYDALLPITPVDEKVFKQEGVHIPSYTVPSGIDISPKEMRIKPEPGTLFHLGALDWMPNREANDWFLDSIWPEIRAKMPHLKFFLAGRNMPAEYRKLEMANVEVLGRVENAREFMLSKQIMVVPLLSGSGMRIKIIEGMALGVIVVSTSVGAEGIACTHNKDILIADTPSQFVEAIDRIINEPGLAETISCNARKLIMEKYENNMITRGLISWLKTRIFEA